MQFKVGDRVEAVKPPVGVEDSEADQVGPGELIAINPKGYDGETHKVLLDSGDSWWYSEDRLRHPIVSKPTPTPSITVGTQVRLTGVVMSSGKDGEVVTIESDGFVFGVPVGALEVIRQPFKRGEVVYGTSSGDTYVVFNDERDGKVDVVDVTAGVSGLDEDATDYERRYERRP